MVGVVVVLSGLAIWKPVQFQWLTALFGGYDTARRVHFVCMAAIVAFLAVHVVMALLVPQKPACHDQRPLRSRGGLNIRRLRSQSDPGVDKSCWSRTPPGWPDPARRRFLAGGASLGALTLLTGCDVIDEDRPRAAENISKFNDAVQAAMFNPNTLAPTYPESAITRPFPFNAYYELDEAPEVEATDWKLEVTGLVDNKKPWTLPELYALPQVEQITRHICVEGWSAIGKMGRRAVCGISSSGSAPTPRAKYVGFKCADELLHQHRHADCAAPADLDDVQFRRPNPAAGIRLPDEDPHADQTRLQESEAHDRRCSSPTTTRAATGKTRATTGSAAAECALSFTDAPFASNLSSFDPGTGRLSSRKKSD